MRRPGYEEVLEALADPNHEQHASMKKWAGKKFDPESLDLAAVNRTLQKVASGSGRRHASGSRTATVP